MSDKITTEVMAAASGRAIGVDTVPVSYPTNLFPIPFCAEGDRDLPSTQAPAKGRTSWAEGFPPVTQMKIREGGIAPNRWDFNGILYLCSRLLWWVQSGGQWTYAQTLDYRALAKDTAPSMVYYNVSGQRNGTVWVCVKDNGPNTANGVHAPGSSTAYWQTLYDYIDGLHPEDLSIRISGEASGSGTFSPSGSVNISVTLDSSVIDDAVSGGIAAANMGMVPDWSRMSTVSNNAGPGFSYTCPSNGYINVRIAAQGDDIVYVNINGRMVTGANGTWHVVGENRWAAWDEVDETIPVAQGDRVTITGSVKTPGVTKLFQFVPAKK
jgi:hypothetical protein